jgi:alanyl-tRNA synthetase
MGFERACSIIQNTKGFTDFSKKPSNYATDVFTPIFRKLEELSGKTYVNIYPELGADRSAFNEEMKTAIAFRVIADHLRTLSFSIADGIMPGNNGRNYVLRRILRRAVRYGRQLGFSGDKPFFGALVETLVAQMGSVFPELRTREAVIRQTLEQEEASFNQTLDRGLKEFEVMVTALLANASEYEKLLAEEPRQNPELQAELIRTNRRFSGVNSFLLYDTYGFPIDLTELLCSERGLELDREAFDQLMEQQQERSRAAQKSTVVRALEISTDALTEFTGFDADECEASVLEIHPQDDSLFVITDKTPFYAEMGGQSGDTGTVAAVSNRQAPIPVTGVQQIGKARAIIVASSSEIKVGDKVVLKLEASRRRPIEAHHTATHLLHWALHEVVSKDAAQQGSSVDENRLRFDFNSAAVTPEQLAAMEEKVNAAIKANDSVSWSEVKHADIKGRADIMQFFGDKYGDVVRVVQIGGKAHELNGYSQELCGGTHVRHTGDIGLFKIKSEGAIASGVRRIEAVCGDAAWAHLNEAVEKWDQELKATRAKLAAANEKLATLGEAAVSVNDFPHIMAAMLAERADITQINDTFAHGQRTLEETQQAAIEAEKRIKKIQSSQAARLADEALAELIAKGEPIIVSFESDASLLQELQNGLKKKNFAKAALLVVDDGEKLHLATHCGADAIAAGLKAGDLLRDLAALAGGKGGGKPDQARGAAPDREKLAEIKAKAGELLQA